MRRQLSLLNFSEGKYSLEGLKRESERKICSQRKLTDMQRAAGADFQKRMA